MYFEILITTIVLVSIVMMALSVKLFFNKKAEFEMHSCSFDANEKSIEELDCTSCQLKDIADCSQEKN